MFRVHVNFYKESSAPCKLEREDENPMRSERDAVRFRIECNCKIRSTFPSVPSAFRDFRDARAGNVISSKYNTKGTNNEKLRSQGLEIETILLCAAAGRWKGKSRRYENLGGAGMEKFVIPECSVSVISIDGKSSRFS